MGAFRASNMNNHEDFMSCDWSDLAWCFFQDFKRTGLSRLLKEKGREQFWPKKVNLRRTRKKLKNGQNFTTFRVNNVFP
jgi:hypothetical protein